EQQMVEIAKAFRSDLSILILDEPTASLTDREADQLFALIAQAKARGVGIIYITHRMQEIRRIGDRITVLRDGRYVATVDARTTSEGELLRLMTGRKISEIFPRVRQQPGETLLEIEHLSTARGTVADASLVARRGEIVGLAGLVGSGKSEIARACFGLVPVVDGAVRFKGETVTNATTREMLRRGLFYLPPDRRDEGLMTMRPARENMALTALNEPDFRSGPFLNLRGERAKTRELAGRVDLRPPKIERAVDHFSGGNQQKIMLAKCLTREVELFVFDEPTVGVDVGTRVAIYQFICGLCEAGAGILLISSDLPEVLHLSHRLYVFYRGRVQAELAKAEISEERVLSHFFEREAA
ncbi:MAG TPA: sugar ABC transporter ATP-binding protein, partial [Kiloniellales bacterium]|nr:sugar ABC transporter ATP-binding protein [Kiloniellales bacterium]